MRGAPRSPSQTARRATPLRRCDAQSRAQSERARRRDIATSAVLHRSMRIAGGLHMLLADGGSGLCRAGADPIRDHPVHRLVIGVPRFLL
jgi:hypothetical protein